MSRLLCVSSMAQLSKSRAERKTRHRAMDRFRGCNKAAALADTGGVWAGCGSTRRRLAQAWQHEEATRACRSLVSTPLRVAASAAKITRGGQSSFEANVPHGPAEPWHAPLRAAPSAPCDGIRDPRCLCNEIGIFNHARDERGNAGAGQRTQGGQQHAQLHDGLTQGTRRGLPSDRHR